MFTAAGVKGAWTVVKAGASTWGFWLKVGAVLALVASLIGFGVWIGSRDGAAEVAAIRLEQAQQAARFAKRLAEQATKYREQERQMGADFIAAASRHSEEMTRVQTESRALSAALLSGDQRLHDRWSGCVSAAAQAAGAAVGTDEGARDREASAVRAIVAAAEADAQIRALQALLIAERSGDTGARLRGTSPEPRLGPPVPPDPGISPSGRALGSLQ